MRQVMRRILPPIAITEKFVPSGASFAQLIVESRLWMTD